MIGQHARAKPVMTLYSHLHLDCDVNCDCSPPELESKANFPKTYPLFLNPASPYAGSARIIVCGIKRTGNKQDCRG